MKAKLRDRAPIRPLLPLVVLLVCSQCGYSQVLGQNPVAGAQAGDLRSSGRFDSVTLLPDPIDDQKLAGRRLDDANSLSAQDENDCEPDSRAKVCRVKILKGTLQSMIFLSIETAGNLAQDPGIRGELDYAISRGQFWSRYWQTLQHFRYSVWNDDDTILTTYVGHPMEGAELEFIWLQNSPRYRKLEFQNSKVYWRSRVWAMIPSAIFSAEWLLGPLSESSMGNQGLFSYYSKSLGKRTNGTGFQDLVITPVGGMLWAVGEDWLDLHFGKKIRMKYRNPGMRFLSALATPTKSGASILRFKAPWYRDSEQGAPAREAD